MTRTTRRVRGIPRHRPRTDEPIVVSKSLDYGEGIPKAYLEDNYTDGDAPMHSSEGFE